ncbi:hypothetical protein OEZ86_006978 [Tetradesmus obliquus]|nr:hypothetical protein OEZ86_006978 [Tetradesmus obliquus]
MARSGAHDSVEGLNKSLFANGSFKDKSEASTFQADVFMLFAAKIVACPRKAVHVWSECPYVHPGEKARRRDPRLHHYSSHPCPDKQKGVCPWGDACHYSHNLFETHLHPEMYRTTMCTAGSRCRRRLCFFAHNPQELRQPTTVHMAVQQQQQQQQQQAAAAADAQRAPSQTTPARSLVQQQQQQQQQQQRGYAGSDTLAMIPSLLQAAHISSQQAAAAQLLEGVPALMEQRLDYLKVFGEHKVREPGLVAAVENAIAGKSDLPVTSITVLDAVANFRDKKVTTAIKQGASRDLIAEQ